MATITELAIIEHIISHDGVPPASSTGLDGHTIAKIVQIGDSRWGVLTTRDRGGRTWAAYDSGRDREPDPTRTPVWYRDHDPDPGGILDAGLDAVSDAIARSLQTDGPDVHVLYPLFTSCRICALPARRARRADWQHLIPPTRPRGTCHYCRRDLPGHLLGPFNPAGNLACRDTAGCRRAQCGGPLGLDGEDGCERCGTPVVKITVSQRETYVTGLHLDTFAEVVTEPQLGWADLDMAGSPVTPELGQLLGPLCGPDTHAGTADRRIEAIEFHPGPGGC
jgi:hypothetical protein